MPHKTIEKFKLKLPDTELSESTSIQKIVCPSCQSEVPPEELNIHDKIGKCCDCGGVFSFSDQLQLKNTTTADPVSNQEEVQKPLARPEGVELFQYGNTLECSMQTGMNTVFMILFAYAIMLAIFFSGFAFGIGNEVLKWIGFGFWFTAIFMGYNLWPFKRKMNLYIADGTLNISWEPTLWKKDIQVRTADINQLYTKQVINNGKPTLYIIVDGPKGQRHEALIPKIKTLSRAKYLEQQIEDFLGIENRSVPEES